MDLVNVNLIYVTEEKKTHSKTSFLNDLFWFYEAAHTNIKQVLDSVVLFCLTVFYVFSALVSNHWNYLMKRQFTGGIFD